MSREEERWGRHVALKEALGSGVPTEGPVEELSRGAVDTSEFIERVKLETYSENMRKWVEQDPKRWDSITDICRWVDVMSKRGWQIRMSYEWVREDSNATA